MGEINAATQLEIQSFGVWWGKS